MRIEKIKLNDEAGLTVMLHTPTPEMASTAATKTATVIICPGGAYEHCSERESDPPAVAFLEMGMQVLVLNYSTGMKAANKRPLGEIEAMPCAGCTTATARCCDLGISSHNDGEIRKSSEYCPSKQW